MKFECEIPVPVFEVMRKVYNAGFEIFVVGGALRDTLTGHTPKDWDLATNAPSDTIATLFPDSELVGASFGVHLIKHDGMEIELARFRTERGYSDNRHPDEVNFVESITEDLLRRDFTFNAMALDIHKNLECVPHATEDAGLGIIRAVGNPDKRLEEDPLRILRAFRLMSEKGFKIEPITAGSCLRKAHLLDTLSGERIFQEFYRILNGEFVIRTLRLMRDLRVLEVIIPEVRDCFFCGQHPKYHDTDVFEHMIMTLPNLEGYVQLAGFFHDIGKPKSMFFDEDGTPHFYLPPHELVSAKIAKKVLTRWHCPGYIIRDTVELIENHMASFLLHPNVKKARKFYAAHGLLSYSQVDLHFADKEARKNPDTWENMKKRDKLTALLDEARETATALKVTDLKINGEDVMNIRQIKPGPEVGKILNECFRKVLDNPSLNEVDSLTRIVKKVKIGKG